MIILGREFRPKGIINNPDDYTLRQMALHQGGKITQFGNLAVITKVRNRSAQFTEVILREPDTEENELIDQVFNYVKNKEMIQLDRTMCQHPEFKYACRLYVSSEFARLALMWGNTLFPSEGKGPDFITIDIPEWPERKVLVFPEKGLTIVLGTDYKGEIKKSMLRQVMYWVKKKGDLGLHAGAKILRIMKNGELQDLGFLFFGLSGTGKTSLCCHSHWLEPPEQVIVRQDDVVILRHDGSCIGTEDSFYIKTDGLEADSQPLLFAAALSPRAILENVKIHPDNNRVDFFDTSLTSNGRAMVKRSDVAFTDNEIDLPYAHDIFFITRRYDIMPPVARLSPEWAAAAFMLGESVETSAGDPNQAGRSKRVVGTNPFIVGSEAEEGNIFLDILRKNSTMQCFILNTGWVGSQERGVKITVKDSVKIIEMIARDKIKWEMDKFWGYEVPVEVPGIDLARFNLRNFYEPYQIRRLSEKLKAERIEWLKQFEDEGLNPEIIKAIM